MNFSVIDTNLTEAQAETARALGNFREEVIEELGYQVNPPWLIHQFGTQYQRHRRKQRLKAERLRRERAERQEREEKWEAEKRKRQKEFEKRCAPPQRIVEGKFCKRVAGGPYWYLHGHKRWVLRPKAVLPQMRGALIRHGFNRMYTGWHRHAGWVERFVEFFEDTQDASMIWVAVFTRNGGRTAPQRIL